MTITSHRGAARVDGTDPTAVALRPFLRTEFPLVLAHERHAEIASIVRNERFAAERAPGRRRGLRRLIARTLLAAARRLAADVVDPVPERC